MTHVKQDLILNVNVMIPTWMYSLDGRKCLVLGTYGVMLDGRVWQASVVAGDSCLVGERR